MLAAEDIEFYQHKGLIIWYSKACMKSYKRRIVRGASTITQQLVKGTLRMIFLVKRHMHKHIQGRLRDINTMQVEQTFTKDEILQMYMMKFLLGG